MGSIRPSHSHCFRLLAAPLRTQTALSQGGLMQVEKRAGKPANAGGRLQNKILLGLPFNECNSILRAVEFVRLPRGTVLNAVGKPIRKAYFVNNGIAPLLTVLKDGRSVEVGFVGREVFVGTSLLAGLKTSATEDIMQVGGDG